MFSGAGEKPGRKNEMSIFLIKQSYALIFTINKNYFRFVYCRSQSNNIKIVFIMPQIFLQYFMPSWFLVYDSPNGVKFKAKIKLLDIRYFKTNQLYVCQQGRRKAFLLERTTALNP